MVIGKGATFAHAGPVTGRVVDPDRRPVEDARVLLVGMRMPPNYGPVYTRDFEQAFLTLAKQQKIAVLPFLLEPIAGKRDAFQADGLHPIAAMQSKLLDHIYPSLVPLLK